MACVNFRFAPAIIKTSKGEAGIIEPAHVYLPGVTRSKEVAYISGMDYFAVPIKFDTEGVVKAYPIGKPSMFEESLLKTAGADLKGSIMKSVAHVTVIACVDIHGEISSY